MYITCIWKIPGRTLNIYTSKLKNVLLLSDITSTCEASVLFSLYQNLPKSVEIRICCYFLNLLKVEFMHLCR